MVILECKMCGGKVELSADKTFGTCEYCGSTSTFPKISDEQRAAAFNRGNHFRRIGEFDKALVVYERIVREDDTDAEAHWCCALCRFGIEYVEDPATYEWLPTCHRASFDSFLEDVDYKAALEYSDGITRRQYMKDAAKIVDVQRGILATSQNTEPFDVFICYKETDEDRQRTQDSIMAQKIYYQLTEQGHRVFFSRITLEDVVGTQYEPYIFAALNSAKVMLVIGTKPEYLNAVWVKNEWSRFLALMRKDRSKVLLPCYRDMDPDNMPEQLSILQSYDMSKIGFIQDLIWGINKILSKSVVQKPQEIVQQAVVAAAPPNNDSAIIMGFLDYEMGKKKSAQNTFWNVLLQDSECAEAYLGMCLADDEEGSASYLKKYERYALEHMSALEKKIFTEKTRDAILRQYWKLGKLDRLAEALDLYGSKVPDDLFVEAIQARPETELVTLFTDHGCDINLVRDKKYSNGTGKLPLLSLMIENEVDVKTIEVLLKAGADPNSIRVFTHKQGHINKYSALSDAVWRAKNVAYVKLLLKYGADPNYINKSTYDNGNYVEKSLLHEAVLDNLPDIAKLLLESGVDPNQPRLYRDKYGDSYYSALHDSVEKAKNPDMVKLLLRYGADASFTARIHFDDSTYSEKTPLHEAVMENLFDIAKLLLEAGTDVNIRRLYRNRYGDSYYSALYDSVWKAKNPDMVKLLLSYGADASFAAKIHYGDSGAYAEETPLNDAVRKNMYEIVSVLLENKADVNVRRLYRDRTGDFLRTALTDAIEKGYWKIASLLLDYNADVNNIEIVRLKDGTRDMRCSLTIALDSAAPEPIVVKKMLSRVSMDTIVEYRGKKTPLKKYPFYIGYPMNSWLREAGWKGPGFFGLR